MSEPRAWAADYMTGNSWCICSDKEGAIADVWTTAADARLIALAPLLLDFVERYRDEAEASGGWKGDDDLFNSAVHLIAKAEGRS